MKSMITTMALVLALSTASYAANSDTWDEAPFYPGMESGLNAGGAASDSGSPGRFDMRAHEDSSAPIMFNSHGHVTIGSENGARNAANSDHWNETPFYSH